MDGPGDSVPPVATTNCDTAPVITREPLLVTTTEALAMLPGTRRLPSRTTIVFGKGLVADRLNAPTPILTSSPGESVHPPIVPGMLFVPELTANVVPPPNIKKELPEISPLPPP